MDDLPQPEQLVLEHIDWMLNLAARLLNDRVLAEDAVQDAFINAFNALDKFEGRSSVKTWLHRITVNAALGKLRQLKRLAEQPLDDLLPEFDQDGCRIEQAWTRLASTQEVMESETLQAIVRDQIMQLSESYRIILQLRDIEGYDSGEVADLIGISQSNVRIRLHRARAALKKLLEPILRGEMSP